ncbi:hypothetical protein [Veronia pacifica]|uniref:Uncharacterized protein n=1 Tax=Veronia pacifica TaxID=1080227 RepID=A0A1C3EJ95_9GAMM|nr:hypothetical protein [Veronia pacifica]ODA33300.1 hypothetical protein A8L45_10905 [Veronia pacifica]
MALTACNFDKNGEKTEIEVPEPAVTVAAFTTKPQFKLNSLTSSKTDQLEFNFSKSVDIELDVYDKDDNSIFQYASAEPTSEYTLNIGRESVGTLLDHGTYHYSLTISRNGQSETRHGEFTKGIRLIKQFDNKVSDISVSNGQLYVATGDYMRLVEVHKVDTRDGQISTLNIDPNQLPKPIYDMKVHGNSLFLAGRKSQWMGGNLLTSYSLVDQSLTVLESDLACKTTTDDECSAVFSLQPKDDALYIGTSNGLYVKHGEKYSKVTDTGLDSESDIKTQFVDQQGRLWIGSMAKGGVAVKDNGQWQAFTEQNSGLPAGGFMDFSQTPSGDILMAGNINGLVKYNPGTQVWNHFTPANSDVLDHNLVSVAYRNGVLIGSHDFGVAKSQNLSQWQVSDNTNSAMLTISTDACEFDPNSVMCKQVIVVERMVTDAEGRVFAAIGKGIYELY